MSTNPSHGCTTDRPEFMDVNFAPSRALSRLKQRTKTSMLSRKKRRTMKNKFSLNLCPQEEKKSQPRRYHIIFKSASIWEKGCTMAKVFKPDVFPDVMCILDIKRVGKKETNVPIAVHNRRKDEDLQEYVYQVSWKGTDECTWQTKEDLGVYDYLAYQFDHWVEKIKL